LCPPQIFPLLRTRLDKENVSKVVFHAMRDSETFEDLMRHARGRALVKAPLPPKAYAGPPHIVSDE
jgi:hypothetical protein